MDNPFHIPLSNYTNTLYPVEEYIRQASSYISSVKHIPIEEATKYVKSILSKHNLKNPKVTYYQKDHNGDMVKLETTLKGYIKDSTNKDKVVVPSFTRYYTPEVQKSIHAEFMDYNTKRRAYHKKLAFKAKQDGDRDSYIYNNILQQTMKIYNNSLSGAYASKSTILRNPTAHYTLTSITRCVSSIGNALTESIVYGNKHFKDFNTTISYITTIATNTNTTDVQECITKYNLHIPTTEEILSVIKESTSYYWDNVDNFNFIGNYVNNLTDVQKVAVMYTNDLWNLKNYNDNLIRNFITELTYKVSNITDDITIYQSLPEVLEILVKLLCHNELKGVNIDFNNMDTNLKYLLSSTASNVLSVLNKYSLLLKTFFFTNILPPTIADIKHMFRKCIVLSDTDSTCGSYDRWVEWYLGKLSFKDDAIPICGAVMTLVSQCVDHGLKILSRNMSLPDARMDVLKMKNEYYWSVFVTTNKNKHYFANTLIQEGNVYREPELEIKGVHLIASSIDQNIPNKVKEMIREITNKLANNEKLSLTYYVDYVAKLEQDLLDRITRGDVSIFRKDTIKEASAYKLSKEQSPYFHHILWTEVFSNKYGYPGEPPYMSIKLPTILETKKKLETWIDSLTDNEMKSNLTRVLTTCNKTNISTFKVPYGVVASRGIPEELIPTINKKRIILDNMGSAYLVLESIGYYKSIDDTIIHID